MMTLARPFVMLAVLLAIALCALHWSIQRHGRDTWIITGLMLPALTWALFNVGG